MSNTAEIRDALESVVRNVGNELILRTENAWGLERWSCCHKDVDGEHSSTCPAVLTLNNASRALALLADMEGEREPVGWMRVRDGVVASVRKSKVFTSDIPLYTHPSPQPSVEVAEIIKAGDQSIELWAEELRTDGYDTSELFATAIDSWVAATKPFRP